MKSPMVTNAPYITEKESYSELQVLQSGGGWYIGTMFEERDANGKVIFQEPGSRDSDYFRTEIEARRYLETLQDRGDEFAATVLRDHP